MTYQGVQKGCYLHTRWARRDYAPVCRCVRATCDAKKEERSLSSGGRAASVHQPWGQLNSYIHQELVQGPTYNRPKPSTPSPGCELGLGLSVVRVCVRPFRRGVASGSAQTALSDAVVSTPLARPAPPFATIRHPPLSRCFHHCWRFPNRRSRQDRRRRLLEPG